MLAAFKKTACDVNMSVLEWEKLLGAQSTKLCENGFDFLTATYPVLLFVGYFLAAAKGMILLLKKLKLCMKPAPRRIQPKGRRLKLYSVVFQYKQQRRTRTIFPENMYIRGFCICQRFCLYSWKGCVISLEKKYVLSDFKTE